MKNIFKLLIVYAAINMGIGIIMSIFISIYTIFLTLGGLATGAGGAWITAAIAIIMCIIFLLIFYFLVKSLFGSVVAASGGLLTKVGSAIKTGGGKMFGYAGRNLKSLNPYRDAGGGLANGLRNAFGSAKNMDSKSLYKASRFANLLGANEFANDLRKGARFKSLTENRVHRRGNDGQAPREDEEEKKLDALDPKNAEAVNDDVVEGEVVEDTEPTNKNLSAFVVNSQGEIVPPKEGEEDDNDELSKVTDSAGNVVSSPQFAISNPGGQNSILVNIGGNSQNNQYYQQAYLGGSGFQNTPHAQYSPKAASQLTSADETTATDPKLMKNAQRDRVAQQQSAVANMTGMPDGSSEENAETLKNKRQQRAVANEGRQAESQAGDILSTNSAIYGTVAPSIMTDEGDYSREAIEKNTKEAQRRYAEGMSDATPAKEKFLNELKDQHGQKVNLPEEMLSGEVEPMTMINEDDEVVVMTDENGNVIARDGYNISSADEEESMDMNTIEADDMDITSSNVEPEKSQQDVSSADDSISSSATDMINSSVSQEQDVESQETVQSAPNAGMPNEAPDTQESSGYDADAIRESMSKVQEEKEKETIQARSPQVDSANSQQMTHSIPDTPPADTTPEAPPAPPAQAQDFASRSSSSDYQDLEKRGVRAFSDDNFSAAATGATLAMIMNEFESRENRSVMGNSPINLSSDSITKLADKMRRGENVDSDARGLAKEYMTKSEGNGAQYSDIDHDRMVESFTSAMRSLQNRIIEVSEEETDGIVRKRGNTGERKREDDRK